MNANNELRQFFNNASNREIIKEVSTPSNLRDKIPPAYAEYIDQLSFDNLCDLKDMANANSANIIHQK